MVTLFNAFMHLLKSLSQLHTSPELKKAAEESGLPTLDYDGCSEIWVRKFDDWVNFASVSFQSLELFHDLCSVSDSHRI